MCVRVCVRVGEGGKCWEHDDKRECRMSVLITFSFVNNTVVMCE